MDKEKYRSPDWQENKLKELYYAFGTSEEEGLNLFLNLVFELQIYNPSFLEKLYHEIEEIRTEGIYEVTEKTLEWVEFWKAYNPNDEAKNPRQLEKLMALKDANYLSQENLGRLYFQLGYIEDELKNHETAARHYAECIRLLPDWSWAYNNLGIAYRKLGRYDEAIAAYQKAIELDPKDATAYNNLGIAYRKLGRHDEAIAAYQKAIELDPKYATAYNNLGIAYRKLGRYNEAIAAYQRAIELDPKYATAYNNLGIAYDDLGRHDEAIAAYRKAIKRDPKDAAPYNGLGYLFLKQGKLEQAKAHLEQAVALDDNAYTSIINLGITYFHLKDRQNAQSQFRSAVEKCPLDSVDGRLNKVTALLGLEQTQEALTLLQQTRENFKLAPDEIKEAFTDWHLLANSPEPPAGIGEFLEQAKAILGE